MPLRKPQSRRMPSLPKRRLGRTGLDVSVLGFGSAPIGDIYAVLDDATAIATAERAAELGVTLFDTAPLYGQGLAEHRMGTVLRRHATAETVLQTKVGRLLVPAPGGRSKTTRYVGGHPFDVIHDYSYDATMRSIEQSLHRLGRARIDTVLIHDADPLTHGPVEGPKRFAEAMAGAHKALVQLRGDGTIRGFGVGMNDAVTAAKYLREGDFDCILLAGRYSLLEQPALDEVLPLAAKKNIGVMLGGVFNSGILATGPTPGAKYNYVDAPAGVLDHVRSIARVCASHGVPLPTAALRFCLGAPAVASLVLGAVTPAEVEANVAALSAKVPTALWCDLKAEKLLAPHVPTPA
jgi:D-threo-aldose 1-dehydrogenase